MLSTTLCATRRGMTLIEIMAVICILSMLMGAGLALLRNLGRSNELTATALQINALVHRARSTALTQKHRVELAFELYSTGATVRSQLRRTITFFHFEDTGSAGDTIAGTNGLNAKGVRVAFSAVGRTGQGLILVGSKNSRLEIAPNRRFDCPEGVAFECDLWMNAPSNEIDLLVRGSSYFLKVDGRGRLQAGGTFKGSVVIPPLPGETQSKVIEGTLKFQALDVLPMRRWIHLEMTLDRGGVRLYVDGVPQIGYYEGPETPDAAVKRAKRAVIQAQARSSNANSEPIFVPETYDASSRLAWLFFSPEGRLDPLIHTRPVELYLERPAAGNRPLPTDEPTAAPPSREFALVPSTDPVQVGGGLNGRLDNVRIASLETGDSVNLPPDLLILPESDPTSVERRKLTIEVMGTAR